jgi:hypothetical protein
VRVSDSKQYHKNVIVKRCIGRATVIANCCELVMFCVDVPFDQSTRINLGGSDWR